MIFNVIFQQILPYRHILTIFLGLGIFSAFSIYHAFISQNRSNLTLFNSVLGNNVVESIQQARNNDSTVAQAVKKSLNEQFNQLLVQLQNEFPLTKEVWQEALNELESLKRNDKLLTKNPIIKHKKNDTPLIKKSRELLASYNIDPNIVKIEIMNDPENTSYAFAVQGCRRGKVQHCLRLNLAQLPQQASAVQEALLRHEIMHLLNYDPLTCAFIEELLKEYGITPEEFWANDTFSDFNKHIEYRADLMASLQNVATAEALMEGFVKHMSLYDDTTDSRTHPSCKQRYDALKNLIKYMNAENQLKMG